MTLTHPETIKKAAETTVSFNVREEGFNSVTTCFLVSCPGVFIFKKISGDTGERKQKNMNLLN